MKFGERELTRFFNTIDQPPECEEIFDLDAIECAQEFLQGLTVELSEEQLDELGELLLTFVSYNSQYYDYLNSVLEEVLSEQALEYERSQKIERALAQKRFELSEQEIAQKFIHGDQLSELSDEARMWHGKIKLLGMRSFKVSWYDEVKYRGDIVFTDEERRKSAIKVYFNRPLFSVPETTFVSLKRRFDAFPPGFYDYIQYLMFGIEKKEKEKPDGANAAVDRTVFSITSAQIMNKVEPDNNWIAIDTFGNDRPTYKGIPEFTTNDDIQAIQPDRKAIQSAAGTPVPTRLPPGQAQFG